MTNNRASTHHLDQSSDQTGMNLPVSDQLLDEHGHLLNSDSWSEAWARQQAQALGAQELELSTARDNHRAQALYQIEGWQRDELFLHYSLTL